MDPHGATGQQHGEAGRDSHQNRDGKRSHTKGWEPCLSTMAGGRGTSWQHTSVDCPRVQGVPCSKKKSTRCKLAACATHCREGAHGPQPHLLHCLMSAVVSQCLAYRLTAPPLPSLHLGFGVTLYEGTNRPTPLLLHLIIVLRLQIEFQQPRRNRAREAKNSCLLPCAPPWPRSLVSRRRTST